MVLSSLRHGLFKVNPLVFCWLFDSIVTQFKLSMGKDFGLEVNPRMCTLPGTVAAGGPLSGAGAFPS